MTAFVIDSEKNPLMPTNSARARKLLKAGKAVIFRYNPFTIILKERVGGDVQNIQFKVDPGSKTSGIALVADTGTKGKVALWGANLAHRGGAIKDKLESRRSLRRGRRNRKLRYRPARFNNRVRAKGWLPPSLMSRVNNITNYLKKLQKFVPITSTSQEVVRFDMQLMENPDISGVEYQQGTLHGYEIKEYLLEKWGRACVYCKKENVPLQVEHIVPRSKGGSNRPSNLTVSCEKCNLKKGVQSIGEFLSGKPELLKKIKAQMKRPLKDAAAVNATRWRLKNELEAFGLPLELSTGGRTKFNRTNQNYKKDHWIDATCVGASGEAVNLNGVKPLQIKAMGRGSSAVHTLKAQQTGKRAARNKSILGFQTGDLVKIIAGKHAGKWGRISATDFDAKIIKIATRKASGSLKNSKLLQKTDGYSYSFL
jgi:5-methylcytosine-specific restriction endonuclease McrA